MISNRRATLRAMPVLFVLVAVVLAVSIYFKWPRWVNIMLGLMLVSLPISFLSERSRLREWEKKLAELEAGKMGNTRREQDSGV
jgi:hypothetical protein